MKKYSPDYFEKKYKILLSKLLAKDSFLKAITQKVRTNENYCK